MKKISVSTSSKDPVCPSTRKPRMLSFLALAASDALGWPEEMPGGVCKAVSGNPHVEFAEWTRRSGGHFRSFEEVIHAGDYSFALKEHQLC